MNSSGRTKKSLKILAIGNSFSVDMMEYVFDVAALQGYEDVRLGNLYIGGCPLDLHVKNLSSDSKPYVYFYNDSGLWQDKGSANIPDVIGSEDWDYVSLQQSSPLSGMPETYEPYLSELISYVKENAPGAKIFWHMTWAYPKTSGLGAFGTYGSDQLAMYGAIVAAVKEKVMPHVENGDISFVVPVGTAIQNVRTSYFGDNLCRDDLHLSNETGRFIAGMMLVRQISGERLLIGPPLPDNTKIDAKLLGTMKTAVDRAWEDPFAITAIRQ